MVPSGKAFGISDEGLAIIMRGIDMAYASAFYNLHDDYEKLVSEFQKREFKEHLDKCLSFHPLEFVLHALSLANIPMEEKIEPMKEKALSGFISAQAKKLANDMVYGNFKPEQIFIVTQPDDEYVKKLFEEEFSFDKELLETLDILYDLDEMSQEPLWVNEPKTSKYPEEMVDVYLKNVRMIDFDDQFKEFFEKLIVEYNMSLNFHSMWKYLDPTWHYYELLKPSLKSAIMKLPLA